MIQNIYDDDNFFDSYINMRNDKESISANEIIEMPAIYSVLPDLKDKKVLDLGCGSGNNCIKAVELGANYVLGTDVSKNMIELAKKTNKDKKIEWRITDRIPAKEHLGHMIKKLNIRILLWKTFHQ